MDSIFIRQDPAGNIKPDKENSAEKIGGAAATIMILFKNLHWQNIMHLLYFSCFKSLCLPEFPEGGAESELERIKVFR